MSKSSNRTLETAVHSVPSLECHFFDNSNGHWCNRYTVTNARKEKIVKFRRVAKVLNGTATAALGDLHDTEVSAK